MKGTIKTLNVFYFILKSEEIEVIGSLFPFRTPYSVYRVSYISEIYFNIFNY